MSRCCAGATPHQCSRAKTRREIIGSRCKELAAFRALLAEMREDGAQGRAGNLNQSTVRRVHFKDEEDRAGNRKRGDEQAGQNGRVGRGEEAEADENNCEPENQHDQQGYGNRGGTLFVHQPVRLPETNRNTQRLGLK